MSPETIDILTRWAEAAVAIDSVVCGHIEELAFNEVVKSGGALNWVACSGVEAFVSPVKGTVDIYPTQYGDPMRLPRAHLRVKS